MSQYDAKQSAPDAPCFVSLHHGRSVPRFHQLLLFSLIALCWTNTQVLANDSWEHIADDLETKEFTVTGPSFFSSKVFVIRTSLNRFRPGVIRAADYGKTRLDVKTMVERSNAVAGINANFFDERGKALGLVMTRGILRKKPHWGGSLLTGIFQATHDGISIVKRNEFKPATVVEAVQAGPRLISDGEAVTGLRQSSHSRRAGVCIDSENRLVLFCVSSGLLGLTISQLQDFLLDPRINCQEALNFDGGGSTQLFLSSRHLTARESSYERLVEGVDAVPIVLGLFLKD